MKRDQARKKQKKKGEEQRESKRMAEEKTSPNNFAQARNSLEMFLFVYLCVIYRFSTYYLGWTKCAVRLSPVVPVFFCMCVNAKLIIIIVIIINFVSFILLVICISNKFACKNQHLQWYLDRQANRCTVRCLVCLFAVFCVSIIGGGNFLDPFYFWIMKRKKTVLPAKRYV